MKKSIFILAVAASFVSCSQFRPAVQTKQSYSGIYPHLAYYNNEGECGTGAVVPWANRLWVITYAPHSPFGSSDKLYEINPNLELNVRPESVGGTPANRMVHKESNQLFIGPYAIDQAGKVRVISPKVMPGRHTGNARHLTDPAGKIYYGTMEEGFYEVDVNSLDVNVLYQDGNLIRKPGKLSQYNELLPGAHGKGLYSGQGVMVFSNNGEATHQALEKFDVEAGVLAEWDGKDWHVVRRNQFVEVTGPGGIYGNSNPDTDPIWATGWDHKSVVVGVRDADAGWKFFRLPKASHSYDGAHGWNTEWPRIRNVGTPQNPDYLMTMHGMFWRFPQSFSGKNASGIRPRSAYLKVIGDFTRWNDRLVFGCDDSAQKEFLNVRKVKGSIQGPGQSNSNLWFTSLEQPDLLGPNTAEGAVWLSENVEAKSVSEPFLFAGWDTRMAWVKNDGGSKVEFDFQVDEKGDGQWKTIKTVSLMAGQAQDVVFDNSDKGEWIRVAVNQDTKATVHFSYSQNDDRKNNAHAMFKGLASVTSQNLKGGLLWGLDNNRRKLGMVAGNIDAAGFSQTGYYELDEKMNLVKVDDTKTSAFINETFAIPQNVVTVDEASVLVVDDKGRRWRLPKANDQFSSLTQNGLMRICREVATERDLFNCMGTFFELPAENADGFAKIRPVASHNFRVHDYASYRGMLVMTGIDPKDAKKNNHVVVSNDGNAAVWAGAIDDLWKMGKPLGHGGPWKNTSVAANVPSDPYLIGFYDRRSLKLSHDASQPITFKIEVEPIGHGPWMTYREVTVAPGEVFEYKFPKSFQSRWIRFVANGNCHATAWLNYE